MKQTKTKIVSALAAVAMAGTMLGISPMRASANYIGDVNGDNVISMSDAIGLARFLNGEYVLSDDSAADLNENYVIDWVDYQILLSFLVGGITSLPYTG